MKITFKLQSNMEIELQPKSVKMLELKYTF